MRVLLSLVVGIGAGVLLGLYLGWVQFPVEFVDSPMNLLAQRYQDEYTVMVAAGFVADRDIDGALARLKPLGVQNVPEYVQEVTERFITTSRGLDDIRKLVALSEGLGRFTPIMESFRQLSSPDQTP